MIRKFCFLMTIFIVFDVGTTGILLDDLLVAENCQAAKTTNTASSAAAITTIVAADKKTVTSPGMLACGDERTGKTFSEAIFNNAVAVATPVESVITNDTSKNSITENHMLQGPRQVARNLYLRHKIETIKI